MRDIGSIFKNTLLERTDSWSRVWHCCDVGPNWTMSLSLGMRVVEPSLGISPKWQFLYHKGFLGPKNQDKAPIAIGWAWQLFCGSGLLCLGKDQSQRIFKRTCSSFWALTPHPKPQKIAMTFPIRIHQPELIWINIPFYEHSDWWRGTVIRC